MTGSWNIDVSVNKFPQKIATAIGELNEMMVGAEYTPIAYIGSQIANGTNYAVLAEQLIVTGKDSKNIVILIFNEKPNATNLTLVAIERAVESSAELGGVKVDVKTEMTDEILAFFQKAREGFVGYGFKPFALLGTQVVKGTNYIYATVASPALPDAPDEAMIVIANPTTHNFQLVEMIGSSIS